MGEVIYVCDTSNGRHYPYQKSGGGAVGGVWRNKVDPINGENYYFKVWIPIKCINTINFNYYSSLVL